MQTQLLRVLAITALVVVAVIALSCGSSSSKNNLSSAQVQAISGELFNAFGSALTAGLTPPGSAVPSHPSLATAMQHDPRLISSDCTVTDTGESCDIVINYQGNCPEGGTIAVSGDLAYTLDKLGNGTDSSTFTMTPVSCSVSGIRFSGDPNVTVRMTLVMQNDAAAYPITFSEKGGITYGPNPKGSCSINVSATVNSPTSCSVSGSICGQKVTGSC